ncbi:hypothetical protein Ancab_039416 [Ancistrocladus abbreviatus]
MEHNVNYTNTGKCGIAMVSSYPIKTRVNPPRPTPTPPTPPSAPATVCDDYYLCPVGSTCCCINQRGDSCFGWGCCPLESATYCYDHYSCCPQDFPICDLEEQTCKMSKDNPLSQKARSRLHAKLNSHVNSA